MADPLRLEELDIIGYANVLDETMLPSIVPPVFQMRSERNRNFLPPYLLNDRCLWNATEVTESEIRDLQAADEISLFQEPFPAQVDFELFVDLEFRPCYKLAGTARVELTAIADSSIIEADNAFRRGAFDEADRLAGIAISADYRKVTPLVIKAAVRRVRKDIDGERLMEVLAKPFVDELLFRQMVDLTCEESPLAAVPRKMPASACSPMHGMACMR